MVEYYAARAGEYEKLYEKPERQADLRRMTAVVQDLFQGKTVLEIACGTGWWTQRIAQTAQSILATDINEPMLDIARSKNYPRQNVIFRRDDMFNTAIAQTFDGLFAGYIWSHIFLDQLDEFLAQAARWVKPGGLMVFVDNRFVDDSNTPICFTDAVGNTFQDRQLENGEVYRILKNFPEPAFVREKLERVAAPVEVVEFEYYWLAGAKRKG